MRPALTPVITRLRLLIGDPAATTQTWTDDDLEQTLDQHRNDWWYCRLTGLPTPTAGTTAYHTFVADDIDGMWDSGHTIYKSDLITTVPADTVNLVVGEWTFAADQAANAPLYISGSTYDLYASAVDVLDTWKAQLKLETFDFTTEDESFKRSQKLEAIDGLIGDYRRQAAPTVGRMRRYDTAPM